MMWYEDCAPACGRSSSGSSRGHDGDRLYGVHLGLGNGVSIGEHLLLIVSTGSDRPRVRLWQRFPATGDVANEEICGSRLRDEARGDSDLDVLVGFAHPIFRNYMGLKRFLERFIGVPVDLVSAAALKPILKEHILREVQYVV